MIKSLEHIAQERDFNLKRYGNKAVALAQFLIDINEQGFGCEKPFGYVADIETVDESRLKAVFEDLAERIDTEIDGIKVGVIYCRSSGYKELPGSNESFPVLYDAKEHEQSWDRFREGFAKAREFRKTKPVLLQNLIGDITTAPIWTSRKVHEYAWPGLPRGRELIDMASGEGIEDFTEQTIKAILDAARIEGIKIPEVSKEEVFTLSFYVEDGTNLGLVSFGGMFDLREKYCLHDLFFCMANGLGDQGYKLNKKGEIQSKDGKIILTKGNKVSIAVRDSGIEYLVGQTNVAFVARSHDYQYPDHASIKRAWGLTSYLTGSNKSNNPRLRSMILEWFDPETGELKETWNLGQDFRQRATKYYHQRTHEVFSVRNRKIESRDYDPKFDYFPPMIGSEALKIAKFYNKKFGVEVEIEGCMKDGKLHVWQITESPLPTEVLVGLTNIPEENILFKTDYGRGAINHSGAIVIKEDANYSRATQRFDAEGMPYLVVGFDDSVTLEKRFLYFATISTISQDVARLTYGEKTNFFRMAEHMQGIAAQTTFNAVQNGRQGGMYYLENRQPKDLTEILRNVIDIVDGVKVIMNVRVEAHREGMQIYKPQ